MLNSPTEALEEKPLRINLRGMRFLDKFRMLVGPERGAQADIARKSHIAKATINRLYHGKAEATKDHILALARALNVPAEYLLDDELEEIPSPPDLPISQFLIDLIIELGEPEARRRLVKKTRIAARSESETRKSRVQANANTFQVKGSSGSRSNVPKGTTGGGTA